VITVFGNLQITKKEQSKKHKKQETSEQVKKKGKRTLVLKERLKEGPVEPRDLAVFGFKVYAAGPGEASSLDKSFVLGAMVIEGPLRNLALSLSY
jgi:hypothetical protein